MRAPETAVPRPATIEVPRGGDGVWEVRTVQGRPCLTPDERSYYLYFVLPAELPGPRAAAGLWLEVEYFGDRFAQFRVQYASTRPRRPSTTGLYKAAEQRWDGDGGRPAAASGAPSSRCPTSTPRARRTRAPPSASSSGRRC